MEAIGPLIGHPERWRGRHGAGQGGGDFDLGGMGVVSGGSWVSG
jgi:hypothetical protein